MMAIAGSGSRACLVVRERQVSSARFRADRLRTRALAQGTLRGFAWTMPARSMVQGIVSKSIEGRRPDAPEGAASVLPAVPTPNEVSPT